MTATSRFKKGIPIVPERDDRLVALVGFPSPLSANGRGLLQRCELTALELPDIRDACHVLDTLAADAVVLDSRCLTSPLYEQCALTLLQLLPLAPDRATTRHTVDLADLKTPDAIGARGLHQRRRCRVARSSPELPSDCLAGASALRLFRWLLPWIDSSRSALTRRQRLRYTIVTLAR